MKVDTFDTMLAPFIGHSKLVYNGTKNYKAILLNDYDKSFMKVILD